MSGKRFPPSKSRRVSRTNAELKERRQKRRKAFEAQRQRELAQGLARVTNPSVSNRVSRHGSVEEERAEREEVTARFLDAIRSQLPALLTSLSEIYPKRLQVLGISMRYECREQGAKVQEYLWYFKT